VESSLETTDMHGSGLLAYSMAGSTINEVYRDGERVLSRRRLVIGSVFWYCGCKGTCTPCLGTECLSSASLV
jgi:hypothetical protein